MPNAVATTVDGMAKNAGIDPSKPHMTHEQVMDMAMKTDVAHQPSSPPVW